jgi:uncharacterized membrane protein
MDGGPKPADRFHAIDWLRGAAVLVMIQCHALALLRPDLRAGRAYGNVLWIDGLVAPSFMTAAGFSMSLVMVRAALAGRLHARIRKTSWRIVEVFAVAYLGTIMFLPVLQDPSRWLQIEILHCIAFSLALALPIAALLSTRPRALAAVGLAIAALVFALSPLAEHVTGPWSHFANTSSGSGFPLFPWAGYVFLGFALGVMAAKAGRRGLLIAIAALAVTGIGLSLLSGPIGRAYPPHEFFVTNPANVGKRVAWIMTFTLLLAWLETRLPAATRSAPIKVLAYFGTSSLSAYFFHEALLYYRIGGLSFDALWGNSQGWASYSALTLILILLTVVVSVAWNWLWEHKGSLIPARRGIR